MEAQPELQRCEDLWFEDGTVVLQAENMLFRVYSGILSRHSAFFETLFRLPQPSEREMYEGCPLVTLEGDTAQAVCRFLLALHDRNFPESYLKDISVAIDLFHMSSKYDASTLKEDVLKTLRPYFPTTLSDFVTSCTLDWKPFRFVNDFMKLACLFSVHAPCHLPAALLPLTTDMIRRGQTGETLHVMEHCSLSTNFTPLMKQQVQGGRFILSKRAHTDIYPSLFRASDCAAAASCNAEKFAAISKVQADDGCIFPFDRFTLHVANNSASSSLCGVCREVFETDLTDGLRKVWDDLPEIFEIGSWDTLLRDEPTP